MPSPFPGLDPYLEKKVAWRDFHATFIQSLRGAINRDAPQRYRAGVEVDIVIREPSAAQRARRRVADVAVVDRGDEPARDGGEPATIVAPAEASLPEAMIREKRLWIEVRVGDSRDTKGRLVTHIEFLSPTNKTTDRNEYIHKRNTLFRSDVNLVEIDLTRGGERMFMDDAPESDGYVLVHRPIDERRLLLWPIQLRDRLPTVPVPLLPEDEPVKVDLQAVMDRAYDEGYFERIGELYATPPEPPLSADDAAWAAEVLRQAGVASESSAK